MKEDTDNCIHDQVARMKMLDSRTGYTVDTTHCSWPVPSGSSSVFTSSYPKGMKLDAGATIDTYIRKVSQWHRDRNLIEGSTDKDQVLKLMQELGELSDSVCKGEDIRDDIGDMLVVIINIIKD